MRWVILTHRYYSPRSNGSLKPSNKWTAILPGNCVSDRNVSFTPYPEGMRSVPLSQSVRPSGNSIFHFYITFLNFENVGFSALRHFGRFVRVRLIRIHFRAFPFAKQHLRPHVSRMIWIMDNLVPPQNMPKLSCSWTMTDCRWKLETRRRGYF